MNRKYIGLSFVLASLVFCAAVYSRLPERMVTHFDMHGTPNGYSSRFLGAFVLPLLGLVVFFTLTGLPKVFPREKNMERFGDTYWFIVNVLLGFLSAMTIVTVGFNLGWPVSVPTFVLLSIGFMFIVLGNVLPRTRSNWLMGIRTPWTLESETVWRETHRLGGKTFVVGGAITMIAAFLPPKIQPIVSMGALMIAGFIPVVYSYVVWRREKNV